MDNINSLAANLANIEKQYKPEFADYPGNIDLNNRKVYHNPNGSIQTEYSIGVAFDPGDNYSINIPTIVDGKPVSTSEAKDHFMKTGEHLGVSYRKPGESVDDFYKRVDQQSTALHERQDAYYNKNKIAEDNSLAASLSNRPIPSIQDVKDTQVFKDIQKQIDTEKAIRAIAAEEAYSSGRIEPSGIELTLARIPSLALELSQWGKAAVPAAIGRKEGIAAVAPLLTPTSVAKAYAEQQIIDLPPVSPSALVAQAIDTLGNTNKIK